MDLICEAKMLCFVKCTFSYIQLQAKNAFLYRRELHYALDVWARHTLLTFTETYDDKTADIQVIMIVACVIWCGCGCQPQSTPSLCFVIVIILKLYMIALHIPGVFLLKVSRGRLSF